MADGCTKLGREGAGTFQCPRPLCIGRNLTYPVPWHLSMPWVGPWLRRCRPTFAVCLPSVPWGLSRARPAALKGATGRKGKIPTYVKRSRALKSARSFSPKFRAAVCHPARAAGVLDAAFGGLPHPEPPRQPSLACKTQQKICNSVTNATFSIFNRAIFYSGPTIFYNIFPRAVDVVDVHVRRGPRSGSGGYRTRCVEDRDDNRTRRCKLRPRSDRLLISDSSPKS